MKTMRYAVLLATVNAVIHLTAGTSEEEEADPSVWKAEFPYPWLQSMISFSKPYVQPRKVYSGNKHSNKPSFWPIRGKKSDRSMKPNGLFGFSINKKNNWKPNSLFTAFKRSEVKPIIFWKQIKLFFTFWDCI